MNPELEPFLEGAFAEIGPGSCPAGHVVVEPDYERSPVEGDAKQLAAELESFIQSEGPDGAGLQSPHGVSLNVPEDWGLLQRYVRRVTFFADKTEGSWVEVQPPGNWI